MSRITIRIPPRVTINAPSPAPNTVTLPPTVNGIPAAQAQGGVVGGLNPPPTVLIGTGVSPRSLGPGITIVPAFSVNSLRPAPSNPGGTASRSWQARIGVAAGATNALVDANNIGADSSIYLIPTLGDPSDANNSSVMSMPVWSGNDKDNGLAPSGWWNINVFGASGRRSVNIRAASPIPFAFDNTRLADQTTMAAGIPADIFATVSNTFSTLTSPSDRTFNVTLFYLNWFSATSRNNATGNAVPTVGHTLTTAAGVLCLNPRKKNVATGFVTEANSDHWCNYPEKYLYLGTVVPFGIKGSLLFIQNAPGYRGVWNYYNRIQYCDEFIDTTASWAANKTMPLNSGRNGMTDAAFGEMNSLSTDGYWRHYWLDPNEANGDGTSPSWSGQPICSATVNCSGNGAAIRIVRQNRSVLDCPGQQLTNDPASANGIPTFNIQQAYADNQFTSDANNQPTGTYESPFSGQPTKLSIIGASVPSRIGGQNFYQVEQGRTTSKPVLFYGDGQAMPVDTNDSSLVNGATRPGGRARFTANGDY